MLWAVEHPAEVLALVQDAGSHDDAVRALMAEPYGRTEHEAYCILDIPFRRLTRPEVEAMRETVAMLSRGELPPDGPASSRGGPYGARRWDSR